MTDPHPATILLDILSLLASLGGALLILWIWAFICAKVERAGNSKRHAQGDGND